MFISVYAQPYSLLAPPSITESRPAATDETNIYTQIWEQMPALLIDPYFSVQDTCRDLLIWLDNLDQQDTITKKFEVIVREFHETSAGEEIFDDEERIYLCIFFSQFAQAEDLNEKLRSCETIVLLLQLGIKKQKLIADIKKDLPGEIEQFLADIDFFETYDMATSSLEEFEENYRIVHARFNESLLQILSGNDIQTDAGTLEESVLLIPGLHTVFHIIQRNCDKILQHAPDTLIREFSILLTRQYLDFKLKTPSSYLVIFGALLINSSLTSSINILNTLPMTMLIRTHAMLFKEPLGYLNKDQKPVYRLVAEILKEKHAEEARFYAKAAASEKPIKEIPQILSDLYFQLGMIIHNENTLRVFLQWSADIQQTYMLANACNEILLKLNQKPFSDMPFSIDLLDILKDNEHIKILHELIQLYRSEHNNNFTTLPYPEPPRPMQPYENDL